MILEDSCMRFDMINFALFFICLCSAYGLWYSYHITDFHFINWFIGVCFLTFLFALPLLILRLFLKLSSTFYLAYSSVFISVFLAEAFLRLLGIGATYQEKREGYYVSLYTPVEQSWFHIWSPLSHHNLSQAEYNYPRTSNSLGLSDREFELEKKANPIRVIGIGDSFTEGDGAPADSTWPIRLQQNLAQKYPKHYVEVYNAGICGSDPVFSYVMLREKLMAFHPDLVVFAINSTDVNDVVIRGGMERFNSDTTVRYRPHPSLEFPLAISYVARLVLRSIFELDLTTIHTRQEKQKDSALAIRSLLSVIYATDTLCRQNNCKLLVLAHPLNYECQNNAYSDITPILSELKSNKQIAVFDFLSYIQKSVLLKGKMAEYYWKMDGHHNPKGYTLMGDAITTAVLPMISMRPDSLTRVISIGTAQ